ETELGAHAGREARVRRELCAAAELGGLPPEAGRGVQAERAEVLSEALRQVEARGRLSQQLEGKSAHRVQVRSEERAAKVARDVADARLSSLKRSLAERLRCLQFPVDLPVEAALALWAEAVGVKQRYEDLLGEESALALDAQACTAATDSLLAAARLAGIGAAGSGEADPEAAARALAALVEEAELKTHEAKRLLERKVDLEAEVARNGRALAEAEATVSALLEQAQCEDEESFRRSERLAAEYRRAGGHVRELELQICAVWEGAPETAEARLEAVGGAEGLAATLESIESAAASLAEAQKGAAERKGALREQLRQWEEDSEASRLRAEEEALVAQVAALSRRYAVDRLALALLDRARERYEREQQPRVVQLASSVFGGLTSGKYPRVFISQSEGHTLRVCDARGTEWNPEQLSRGTREQLYVAFRIAVIQDFAQSRHPLPVLVDDVLVNFDPERAAGTLDAFAHLARSHQMIAFTCHPHFREMYRQRGAHVMELQQPSFGLDLLQTA
ncbi:MAG TPA: DNA repair protein Rad50, partial [Myxococcaceae bacterium]|nr:DNA repair protein Rad50 [Myxococcaceae bacterium]